MSTDLDEIHRFELRHAHATHHVGQGIYCICGQMLAADDADPNAALKEHKEREWRALVAVIARTRKEERDRIEREGDGYHTFAELYEYRMLYHAHAAEGWLAAGIPVVKSWRHSTGELCFGGDHFIVTATLPTGQVSNHYKSEHWYLFGVPIVDRAPEWDGHTPKIAADRLRKALEVR